MMNGNRQSPQVFETGDVLFDMGVGAHGHVKVCGFAWLVGVEPQYR